MQAFCHETLWYEYLQPSLAKEYPEIQMISPPCMFASSDKLNLKRPLEKAFGVLGAYGRMFGQEERGVLVMENVTLPRLAFKDSEIKQHLKPNVPLLANLSNALGQPVQTPRGWKGETSLRWFQWMRLQLY